MMELDRMYSIKEIENLKDFVTVAYVIIDDIYQKVTPTHIANRCNINDSIMSDSEIITICIVGELLTIDSEKAWLGFCKKNMRDLFPKFCDRTRFNRTRRNLHAVIEEIRKELSNLTDYAQQPYRIVDSILTILLAIGILLIPQYAQTQPLEKGTSNPPPDAAAGDVRLPGKLTLQEKITDWVYDDDKGSIYAISGESNKFLQIREKGLAAESILEIPSMPVDIELFNGKLYILLSESHEVRVLDAGSKKELERIPLVIRNNMPFDVKINKIFVSKNKLFYTHADSTKGIYAYDYKTRKTTLVGDKGYYKPGIALDNKSNLLYLWFPDADKSVVQAFRTDDLKMVREIELDPLNLDGKEKASIEGNDLFYSTVRLRLDQLDNRESTGFQTGGQRDKSR